MEMKQKISKTIAYYVSYITIGFVTGIIGPSLPGLSEHVGTNLGGISYLFPILSVGYMIGSFVAGRLYDKVKGHPITVVALVILLVVMIFVPVTPLIWLLLVLFFFVGLGSGGIDVGGNTLLIWTHGDKVGPFIVGLHFFYGLGALISPLIVAQTLRTSGNITWAYWILAVICVPITIYFLIIKSPEHVKPSENVTEIGANRLLVLLISIFMFLHVGAELSFGSWIYSFAIKMRIADETRAAFLTSAYWSAVTVGRLIAVAIALKVKARAMLIVDLLGCMAAVIILLLFPASVQAVWIGTILLGFFIASLIPQTFTFAGGVMDISGKVASWFVIGLGAGNLFFPWLIGQLFEPRGAVALPIVNLFTFVLALGLLVVIFAVAKKRSKT